MLKADIPKNEAERLEALYDYQLLDTPCEKIFDTITALAASICDTPISAISLIDKERQWFKSSVGLKARESHRDYAFCAHTILNDEMIEVEDAILDHRFADNPFVIEDPNIRFYLGVPLKTQSGYNIGSLCVIDQRSRVLNEKQKQELKHLAVIIMTLFDIRKQLLIDQENISTYVNQINTSNSQLKAKLKQEKSLAKSSRIFNRMYTMLQSCYNDEEAIHVVQQFCKQLFPNLRGSLYLSKLDTHLLDLALSWNSHEKQVTGLYEPMCWGLRGEQVYYCADAQTGVVCQHIISKDPHLSYLCMPLAMHGEIIGLFCLESIGEKSHASNFSPENRSFAIRLARHIALAISNIRLRKILQDQSMQDALTGMHNRRYLYEYFDKAIRDCVQESSCLGVMIVDIDFFKSINDSFGHNVGDEVLKQIASLLNSVVSSEDIVSRVGGEEFVYVLSGDTPATVQEKAEKIFQALTPFHPVVMDASVPAITFSAGLAVYPEDGKDISALLKASDEGLYKAKNTGRSKLVVYSKPIK